VICPQRRRRRSEFMAFKGPTTRLKPDTLFRGRTVASDGGVDSVRVFLSATCCWGLWRRGFPCVAPVGSPTATGASLFPKRSVSAAAFDDSHESIEVPPVVVLALRILALVAFAVSRPGPISMRR